MKIHNLKIGERLALLTGILLLMTVAIGFGGWQALRESNARNEAFLRKSQLLGTSVDTARMAQVEFKIQVQEWKNTLLRGNNPDAFKKYQDGFLKSSGATRSSLKKLENMLDELGLSTSLVQEALKTHEELQIRYLDALKNYGQGSMESARIVDKMVTGIDRAPTRKIDEIVMFIQAQSDRISSEMMDESVSLYRNACLMLISAALFAIGSSIVGAIWLTRSITRPINDAVKFAQTVSSGDLTQEAEIRGNDETGQLMQSLKHMNDNLARIVSQVRSGTNAIASASAQIASGSLNLSSRTEEQASSLEETASSMEELTSTVRQNADNARQANQLAVQASNIAIAGGAAMSQVVSTMEEITASSTKMADIIGVIDGIAFQTNILALNAAVEAARAGEQGRGFAVVASEVRNLAQRSAGAAREIKALIDNSLQKVESGSRLVGDAGATMEQVVASIKRVHGIMDEIAIASHEQSAGIEQVNQAITQMDTVTQQNATLVDEAAAASGSLRDQANDLARLVSAFKTGKDDTGTESYSYPANIARLPIKQRPILLDVSAAPQKLIANAVNGEK